MRIVSLVPSSTETLLGLGADLVACTRFCEQPGMPTVGGTKNPDIGAIVALAPDLVVMDIEENRHEDAVALERRGVPLMSTNVLSVDDARFAVTVLAAAADAAAPPWSVPPPSEVTQTAIVPIWRRPWMLLGNGTYGASLLAHVGIRLVAPDGRYPAIELAEYAASLTGASGQVGRPRAVDQQQSPDLVLVPSEPYSFKPQHLDELRAAFPGSQILEIDGQDLFWWGIRTPAAIERLAAAMS